MATATGKAGTGTVAKDRKAKLKALTLVKTPEFRCSYPHLFKPYKSEDADADAAGKYSMALIFDDDKDLTALRKAEKAAKILKWGEDEKKWPRNLRSPFRDGDEKETDGYGPGKIFINATSKTKPGLIDQRKDRIHDETDERFYPGCYARASLQAYTYDTKGNKGVAFALHNVQKTRDGQPFSGRNKAEDDFDEIEVEDGDSAPSEDQDFDLED